MSKRNKGITLLVTIILLIIIGGIFIFDFIKKHNNYSNIIKSNWNIELPSEYKEIYSCDDGGSFLGDGKRYHVFEYKDNSDVDKILNLKSDKSIIIESEINKILTSINVDRKYLPNFEDKYKYYLQVDNTDSSKLYLIFSENNNMIYIIEDIQ